jgi:TPR repeat protein
MTALQSEWRKVAGVVALAALGSPLVPVTARQLDTNTALDLAKVRADASAGDAVAQLTLGSWLLYVQRDAAEALRWFRSAAVQQLAPAEYQLGVMYDGGLFVESDPEEALLWYRRAADHGSPTGARAVGDFYRLGRGAPTDVAEAARWYRRGAEAGDLRSQYHLGQLYFDGAGVARDYASAYVWFTLAARQTPLDDNRTAIVELANIASVRMSEDERRAAERRIVETEERMR